jgi:hypothetical protein
MWKRGNREKRISQKHAKIAKKECAERWTAKYERGGFTTETQRHRGGNIQAPPSNIHLRSRGTSEIF